MKIKTAEVKYFRTGHIIRDTAGEIVFTGQVDGKASINAAKRESRRIQDREGPCLRVVK